MRRLGGSTNAVRDFFSGSGTAIVFFIGIPANK
jgi:hypothetical protein